MLVWLSPDAAAELETIGDYIARDNPRRAVSFVAELRAACLGLADMPRAFPLVARYAHLGVRHRAHGHYQIFYRAEGEPVTRIEILHIIHGARDHTALLF